MIKKCDYAYIRAQQDAMQGNKLYIEVEHCAAR